MTTEIEMPARLLVVPAEAYASAAATWIGARIRSAVARRGTCSLALSGGSTPGPVYRALAGLAVPWPQVEIFFADERRVDVDHPDSNARLVQQTLLSDARVEPRAVWPMDGTGPEADAVEAYEHVLPVHLDIVVLGMGTDGHTASLFPGSAALDADAHRVLAVAGPLSGHGRITLTPVALRAAHERIVLVTGTPKAATVRAVFDEPVETALRPAQLALNGTWILDQDATGQLVVHT